MAIDFPFLTSYDPPGTSEGTLDPLGLYQIADQLAVQLVPAVRERMQRIRFLTAMAVGALVTEGFEDDPALRDASPYLVWEWLVVESLIRTKSDDPSLWGVPGTLVTRRALERHGYLDAASYLKTPRIFGFHGVYKRLAMHLGLVDVNLGPGSNTEDLAEAWARDRGLDGLRGAKSVLAGWSAAVQRGLAEKPPRSKSGWGEKGWAELADAFAPATCKGRERRFLKNLLLGAEVRNLGAFPALWKLQDEFQDSDLTEERLHDRLEAVEPGYGPLLRAIRAYEAIARRLQDAFDVLRAEAGRSDVQGFVVASIAKDADFVRCVMNLHDRFEAAHEALGQVTAAGVPLPTIFTERFRVFAEPMNAEACALALCDHHVDVQKKKGDKRAWFDPLGGGRIFIRLAYRQARPELQLDRYLHDYRGWPIRRFKADLS